MHVHRVALWLAVCWSACGTSHAPPVPCEDGVCPEGQLCVRLPSERRVCADLCDRDETARCSSGAACTYHSSTAEVCWPGGDLMRGAHTIVNQRCGFGLTTRRDFESEPIDYTCQPVCELDEHCSDAERCQSQVTCAPPCPEGTACGTDGRCVDGYCMNRRRYERLDCDGDGTPDCPFFTVCDAAAVTGCGRPPEGEE